jgi:hypothetical protein
MLANMETVPSSGQSRLQYSTYLVLAEAKLNNGV